MQGDAQRDAATGPGDAAVAPLRTKPVLQSYRRQLIICVGPYCTEQGMSAERVREIGRELLDAGLLADGPLCVKPTLARCLGACEGGPIMCVHPESSWYFGVNRENFPRILAEHLLGGKPVDAFIFHQGPTD